MEVVYQVDQRYYNDDREITVEGKKERSTKRVGRLIFFNENDECCEMKTERFKVKEGNRVATRRNASTTRDIATV